ncbi:MAG: hypothetical protein V3S51_00245 [Dehalococcoidia bacterium]
MAALRKGTAEKSSESGAGLILCVFALLAIYSDRFVHEVIPVHRAGNVDPGVHRLPG